MTKNIVILSTAEWDNPFWTNKQHVAVTFAKKGIKVFYIDSLGLRRPSVRSQDLGRILRRIRKGISKPKKVQENIWVWSPLVLPLQSNALVRVLNSAILKSFLFVWLRLLGFKGSILWTYNPLTTFVFPYKWFHHRVYHCVDDIKAQPGMPAELIEEAEKDLARKVDLIFTTSLELQKKCVAWNQDTYYFANVADYNHFSRAMNDETRIPKDIAAINSPRIGFIGAISGYKLDFDLLVQIATRHPEWSVVLIGKIGEGDPWTDASALRQCPNIHLLGPRAYGELPGYLKGIDVAILPNRLNEYTASMFPMKFFEYLAAGKSIVSVKLPALAEFCDIVYLANNDEDFVQAIERGLCVKEESLQQRLNVAKQYTYEARTEQMLNTMTDVFTRKSDN